MVNRAIILTSNFAVDGTHTPQEMFVWTMTVASYCAYDKDWDVKEEIQGSPYMRRHHVSRQTTDVTGRATSPDSLSD